MPPLKRKYAYTLLVLVCLAASGSYLHYKYPSPPAFPGASSGHIMIAHAGGVIDGHPYTNSLEAVQASVRDGFRYIELDLRLTTDKRLVAVHDWEELNTLTHGTGKGPLSLEEFKQRRIYGQYTPLDGAAIKDIFLADPRLCLVTDKLDDFDALLAQLPIPQDRLLVEVFSYAKYAQALRKGIRHPMLCIWDKDSLREYSPLFSLGRIAMITVPAQALPEMEQELAALRRQGVCILAFSSNDHDFMGKYLNNCVNGFYTDNLGPASFSEAKTQ